MPYVKIEPLGCCIHKGWLQVRLSFFLEPTDPRYKEHHVYVVDETSLEWLKGYKGELNKLGSPLDQADYDAWIASLPHVWRDNPFHNHFIFVDAEITDDTLIKQIQDSFNEFFTSWCKGVGMIQVWHSRARPRIVARTLTTRQRLACENRLTQIKAMVIV